MKSFSILIILAIFLIIPAVYAQVQYPIQELGNCTSQQDCEKYCDNIQNSESCINFAEKEGMMTKEEIDEARKVLPYLKSGETPGKCSSKKTCDEYCNKDENFQECITFAEKAGLITGEELAMVKKTGGKGPGGCKSKETCDAFCNDEANIEICVDFAVQNGMMDAKDAEMVKKTGGKGPGNCKSKEECDAFCNNPDNQETCTNFAIEHNLLSGEELKKLKKGQEFMNSEEGKCMMQCLKESGVDSRACGENGAGPEACKTCGDKCFPHDENSGNCLSQEEWEQKNQACKSQCEDCYLEDIKGTSENGQECVVDERCVQGDFQQQNQEGQSGSCGDCASQCESRPGQRLRGTDCINNQCQCFYEDEQQEQGQSGEGQQGEQNNQEQIQQSPQQPQEQQQESSPPAESSGDSGGEQVTGTGMVIMKLNSNGIIARLIEYARGLF